LLHIPHQQYGCEAVCRAGCCWTPAHVYPIAQKIAARIRDILNRSLAVPRSIAYQARNTQAANHHEVRLVQLCFDFYTIEAKLDNLIGDRAYDSDPLDE
jgi:hypothetical protein